MNNRDEYTRLKTLLDNSIKSQQGFLTRAGKVVARYRDERDGFDDRRRFNILYANIETLRPSLYARLPKPMVSRRFKDADPAGKVASQLLERGLHCLLDGFDFDAAMRLVVLDFLLTGRGQLWLYHEPQAEYQPITARYVHWSDWGHEPARYWDEVRYVWKRAVITMEEARARFGMVANRLPVIENDAEERVEIFELWHKPDLCVYYLHREADVILGKIPDPLGLQGFFPCVRPLLSVTTSDSLLPIPEFCQYQDQAGELDDLTDRIHKLTTMLRVAGIYDASAEGIADMLEDSGDGRMTPIANWAALGVQSGLAGLMQFMPIEPVIKALQQLYSARDSVKQVVYEVLGISDILRGASNPNETATAQNIKNQWGGLRIRERQNEVQRFVRDIFRQMAELLAEKVSPAEVLKMSGLSMEVEQAEAAFLLLKSEKMRHWRVDVETDSTLLADNQAIKAARLEYLSSMSNFLEKSLPLARSTPSLAPMLSEMGMYVTRAFDAALPLEETVEVSLKNLANLPPEHQQVASGEQADLQLQQARLQLEREKITNEMALARDKATAELMLKRELEAARLAEQKEARQMQESISLRPQVISNVDHLPVIESWKNNMSVFSNQLQGLDGVLLKVAETLGDLQKSQQGLGEYLSAPREISRDKDGVVLGVKVAGNLRPVLRDGDGYITGIE